jgi:hypothetical protein
LAGIVGGLSPVFRAGPGLYMIAFISIEGTLDCDA